MSKRGVKRQISVTLQSDKVKRNVRFILLFKDTEMNISAAAGDGQETHTVSSRTAGTKYTFSLFSVFESFRRSGGSFTAVTARPNAEIFR
ncbi:hypothetical protein FQN60_006180 [Etheostoma spectabile]|uniref:Uncharacterized protein n=1 Tax=Etheostoma spectabile TaxID=54343 RepID=A0A5J5CNJ4_9PERO|nr:hypothetical protein FQN60_006180 [Etheostoma spectabile]